MSESPVIPATAFSGYGGWIPTNPAVYNHFIRERINNAAILFDARKPHIPAVKEFEETIKHDDTMLKLFNQIFLQVEPELERPHIEDLDSLLYSLDDVLKVAPSFTIATDSWGNEIGEPVGVPVYVLFDILSNTAAAYDLFRMEKFNNALEKMLNQWGDYLMTKDSNSTLTDKKDGWFGSLGIKSLEDKDRGVFNATWIVPDHNAVNRGYTSWDEFFTRNYIQHKRPIDFPENKTLLHSACESTVYRIAYKVKDHDRFWLKGQNYSLYDMLNKDEKMSKKFVNGTVYQAFLSPQDYHRWRSPIDGTIVKVVDVPGTYYAVLPDEGAPQNDQLKPGDPRGAIIRSQAWITMHATRALIYIKPDNELAGNLMCFIGVGMVEVSTCQISVKAGDHVKAGNQLGMFHFGGSSHALIFEPNVILTFEERVKIGKHLLVNSIIGQFEAPKSA